MKKIDRLGWAAGIAFRAYGLSIGVRVSDRNVLERVLALLPPGWKPAAKPTVRRLYSIIVGGPTNRPGVRRFNLLYSDSARVLRTPDLEELLRQFEQHLHLYVGDRAPRRTFVHAGVVGVNGQAILVPGRSGSGKSSLVTALVKAGATYYSDDFAVLDEQGRVHPYAVPLSIRQGQNGAAPVKLRIEEIGGVAGARPLPVGLVLVTRFVSGSRFRPRPLSAGHAVLELLANTLPVRRRPERVLDTLTQVVSQARVLRGPRGEAAETACQILGRDLLGRERGAAAGGVKVSARQGL
jgi:hypothetical protein